MSKFDWKAAKSRYISSESVTYLDLSEKFGMSVAAIKAYQKRHGENWPRLRRQAIQNVSNRLPEVMGETLAQIQARHVKVGKLLQEKGLEAIQTGKAEIRLARDARDFLVDGIAIERRTLGMDAMNKSQGVNVNVTMSITDLAERIRKRTQQPSGPDHDQRQRTRFAISIGRGSPFWSCSFRLNESYSWQAV